MKKILISIGAYLLDPIRKIGLSRMSDGVVTFSNKNPWFKILITFLIVIGLVVIYYIFENEIIF